MKMKKLQLVSKQKIFYDITNEQCLILATSTTLTTSSICLKGSNGWLEINDCNQIKIKVINKFLENLIRQDSIDKCVLGDIGCEITKKIV